MSCIIEKATRKEIRIIIGDYKNQIRKIPSEIYSELVLGISKNDEKALKL